MRASWRTGIGLRRDAQRLACAAMLFLSVGSGACRGDGGGLSTPDLAPPPPVLASSTGQPEVPAPPAEGSPELSREIEELLALQSRRDQASESQAAYWQAGAVLRWNEIARGLVMKYRTSPPNASRVYALLSVAQHDALVRVAQHARQHRRAAPHHLDERIRPQFSAEPVSAYPSDHAAVATASALVLASLYPNRAQVTGLEKKAEEHRSSRMRAGMSLRGAIEAGERIGRAVAEQVIARAKNDRSKREIPWSGEIPRGHDKWHSSESPPVEPLRANWGRVQPWFLDTGDQLRPPPPPDIDSAEFKEALDEVRRYSRMRTPEQLRIAQFWADGPGSSTPPGHWNQIAEELIRARPRGELEAARVLAYLNMALMDAGIACWDAKYAYWLIRPSQVDPTITLPVGLPNFPAYPSGHSTFSGAAAEILAHFFPEEAPRLRAMAEEASASRVYGGIHYRFDAKEGMKLGQAIGRLAAEREVALRDGPKHISASR